MTGIAVRLAFGWLGRWIAGVRAGKQGPTLQRIDAFMLGHKTWLGAALACVTAALLYLGDDRLAGYLTGPLAGCLLGAGLLDKGWRSAQPEGLDLIRHHAGDITAVFALLGGAFAQCDADTATLLARLHLTCGQGLVALGVLSAVLVQLGVEVKWAAPPRVAGGAK